jgi:hypothetical protein
MMEDKDILEYENIGRKIKKSNKYSYIRGKQLTDPGSGTRVYDIDNYRLPSVTTILGATKNKSISKRLDGQSWRRKRRTNQKPF